MTSQKVSLRAVLEIIEEKCREIDRGLKDNFEKQDKVIGRKLMQQMDVACGLLKKIEEKFKETK